MDMINQPPHLPNKACSLKLHESMCTIRVFIFYIVIALFSGITGALVTYSWIVPYYSNSELYLFRHNTASGDYNKNESADNILARRFQYNTVRIFDKSKKILNDFYKEDSFVGRGVLLSSNGWVVFYDPDFNYTKIKNWSVIDYKGIEHKIEKTLFDELEGFVYIKLSGEEFHVSSFSDLNSFVVGNKIWLSEKNTLSRSIITEKNNISKKSYFASENYFSFKTDKTNQSSKIVLDDQGKFLGFLNEDGTIKNIWKVETELKNILDNGNLAQNIYDFKGFFVSQDQNFKIESENKEIIKGFYVESLKKYISKDYVQVGDIILEINSKEINEDNLAYLVININKNHSLKIWRNGEKIDIIR